MIGRIALSSSSSDVSVRDGELIDADGLQRMHRIIGSNVEMDADAAAVRLDTIAGLGTYDNCASKIIIIKMYLNNGLRV